MKTVVFALVIFVCVTGFAVESSVQPKDLATEIEMALDTGLKLWYPASVESPSLENGVSRNTGTA